MTDDEPVDISEKDFADLVSKHAAGPSLTDSSRLSALEDAVDQLIMDSLLRGGI